MAFCCQRDDREIEVEYDRSGTYEFRSPVARRVLENLGLSVGATIILTVFLHLPPAGQRLLSPNMAAAVTVAVFVVCMVTLCIPYILPSNDRRARVSPTGVEIERRSGKTVLLRWARIRGYVYDGVRWTFLVEDAGGVHMKLLGLTPDQRALLRRAIRSPLESTSMKWRGAAPEGRSRGSRLSLLVFVALFILGGIFISQERREVAAVLLILGGAYLAVILIQQYRKRL